MPRTPEGLLKSRRIAGFFIAVALGVAAALFAGAADLLAQSGSPPFVWVADSQGRLGVLDPYSGKVKVTGQAPVVLTDIAFAPDGRLYGVSFDRFYQVSPDGEVLDLGPHPVPCGNALEISADGVAYVMGCSSGGLYAIDLVSGKRRLVFDTGYVSAGDLAWLDGRLYMAASGADESVLVALDPDARRADEIGPMGASYVYGLAVGPDGGLFAGAGVLSYAVDIRTGRTKLLSAYRGGLGGAWGWASERRPAPNS